MSCRTINSVLGKDMTLLNRFTGWWITSLRHKNTVIVFCRLAQGPPRQNKKEISLIPRGATVPGKGQSSAPAQLLREFHREAFFARFSTPSSQETFRCLEKTQCPLLMVNRYLPHTQTTSRRHVSTYRQSPLGNNCDCDWYVVHCGSTLPV